MANKSSQQKVTRSGQVYNSESAVAEDTPTLPVGTGASSVTRSGEVYEKPAVKDNTPTTNDIKNTPEFKKARAKYNSKQYDNLTDDQKDRLAEKDVEDAARVSAHLEE